MIEDMKLMFRNAQALQNEEGSQVCHGDPDRLPTVMNPSKD